MQGLKKNFEKIQARNDHTAKKLEKSVIILIKALDVAYNKPGILFWRGVIRGVGQGLGATIGVAVVLLVISWLLRLFGGIPAIGEWLNALNQRLPY